jgi:hypothetical protein
MWMFDSKSFKLDWRKRRLIKEAKTTELVYLATQPILYGASAA